MTSRLRGALLAGLACAASAQAVDFGGRLEGGVALPLSQPQRSLLEAGFDLRGVGFAELLPFFDVELHLAQLGFGPRSGSTYTKPAGAFGLGAGVRLKRPLNDARIIPWVSVDVGWSTSLISNLELSPTAGVSFVPAERLPLLVGLFARYSQLFALGQLADRTSYSAAFLSIGLAVELSSHRHEVEPLPLPPEPPPPPVVASDVDTDGDGVPDAKDSCPTVAGGADTMGCPQYKEVVVTTTHIEIKQKLYFAFGTTSILPKSFQLLDEVVQALTDRPSVCVRVEGHTDSKGQDDANLRLSEGRASSVREYLVKQGISAQRLAYKGYGAALPLDENSTPEGRENNRRVEFVLVPCGDVVAQ